MTVFYTFLLGFSLDYLDAHGFETELVEDEYEASVDFERGKKH